MVLDFEMRLRLGAKACRAIDIVHHTIAAIRVVVVIDRKCISQLLSIAPFSESRFSLTLNVIVFTVVFDHLDFILYRVI